MGYRLWKYDVIRKTGSTLPSEEDWATAIGNMHKNLAKLGRVVFELRKRTDRRINRQTDRHAHRNTSQLYRGEVINSPLGVGGCKLWWEYLTVCMLAYPQNHMAKLHAKFLSTFPVAVARSSSDGVAIRCVGLLLVLWMTSCFHKLGCSLWCVMCISKRRERNSRNRFQPNFAQRHNKKHTSWVALTCAPGANDAIYNCLLY